MKTFAEYIKLKRIESGLTLRGFCKETGFDPSNWSKVERELKKPPTDIESLTLIAATLNISRQEEFSKLKDLAVKASIPRELIEEEVLDQLPVFFRTVRGEPSTEDELKKLYETIKLAWTPEN